MKPFRRILTVAAVGALGAATWGVGTSLVKDVQFARAEGAVADARAGLAVAGDMSGIYKAVNHVMEKSVVHIQVTKMIHNPGAGQMNPQDLFKFFGPDGQGLPRQRGQQQPQAPQDPQQSPDDQQDPDNQQSPDDLKEMATGSGCIMDVADGYGYIVTNNHVVSDASDVDVVLSDGRHIENATVVATDPKSDIAVVKIKADRLIPAKWGDSDQLEKGDMIVAFGSPFGFVGSMSHGIVSALNRDRVNVISNRNGFSYENFIQVDAAINPGNSGGPLCNLKGEVVGINTAIASRSGSFSGIGFAIPSDQAKGVYQSLKDNGKVVRGYLGVGIVDVNSDEPGLKESIKSTLNENGFKGDNGVLVSQVRTDGPAMNVLQLSDVITEIDGKPLKTLTELRTKIAAFPPGTTVELTVWRDNKFQKVDVKLGTQPEGEVAAAGNGNRATPERPQQMNALGLSVTTPTADDLQAAGLPADTKGAMVKQVRANSLAGLFGIAPGEVITRIGQTPITSAEDAKAALTKADLEKGVRIDLVNKEGQRMVTLSKKTMER